MQVWKKIVSLVETGAPIALVSVLRVQGSAPREAGARMIVLADGRISGTIGGGSLEWQALAAARTLLADPASRNQRRSFALGPDLGQCCGGRVDVSIERLDGTDLPALRDLANLEAAGPFVTLAEPSGDDRLVRRSVEDRGWPQGPLVLLPDGTIIERFHQDATSLLLFGAGHVGKALVLALAPLPFRVVWIDPRPDAFPDRLPPRTIALLRDDPTGTLDEASDGSLVLVMTHSHALDLDIVARALKNEHLPYVGLIGSSTKRARFMNRLHAMGLGEAATARLVCPIGMTGIRSKDPAAIAAGIAADLLIRREHLESVPDDVRAAAHG